MFIDRQTQLGWRAARSGVGDLDFLPRVPEGGASSMSVGCRGESIESVLIHATFENEKTAFHRVHELRRELTDLHGEPAVDKTNADLDRISAVCTEHAAPEAAAAIDDLARQSQGAGRTASLAMWEIDAATTISLFFIEDQENRTWSLVAFLGTDLDASEARNQSPAPAR